jgi:hypothetical protein
VDKHGKAGALMFKLSYLFLIIIKKMCTNHFVHRNVKEEDKITISLGYAATYIISHELGLDVQTKN